MMDSITICNAARSAAVIWLHEVDEHMELLSKSVADWPRDTYELAVHIQCAIDEAVSEYKKL